MFYHFLYPYAGDFSVFNLFRYLTFRTGGAILTALIISFLCGDPFIRWLKSRQAEGQPIRHDGPESHLITKKGTPTMGGGLILLALTISTVLWMDLSSYYVWIVLFVTLCFGALGAYDDYKKLTKRSSDGISGKTKLIVQITISLLATYAILAVSNDSFGMTISIPFLKDCLIDVGFFFYIFTMIVIVGASNAVNLTDGLDGLAIVPVMIAAACFALIAYLVGNAVFSGYLQIHHVVNTGELAIFCGALVGSGLGFLWFNAPPAKVFIDRKSVV